MASGYNYMTLLDIFFLILILIFIIVMTLAVKAERDYFSCKNPTLNYNMVCPSDLLLNSDNGVPEQANFALNKPPPTGTLVISDQTITFPYINSSGVCASYPLYIHMGASPPVSPTNGVSSYSGVSIGYEIIAEGTSVFLLYIANTVSWNNNYTALNGMLLKALNDGNGISGLGYLVNNDEYLTYTAANTLGSGVSVSTNASSGLYSIFSNKALQIPMTPASTAAVNNPQSFNTYFEKTKNSIKLATPATETGIGLRTCIDPDFDPSIPCNQVTYHTDTGLYSIHHTTKVCDPSSTLNFATGRAPVMQLSTKEDCGMPYCTHPGGGQKGYNPNKIPNTNPTYQLKSDTAINDAAQYTYNHQPLNTFYGAGTKPLTYVQYQALTFCGGLSTTYTNAGNADQLVPPGDKSTTTPTAAATGTDKYNPRFATFPNSKKGKDNTVILGFK